MAGVFGISLNKDCWKELKWGTSLLQPNRGDSGGGFSIFNKGKIQKTTTLGLVRPFFDEKAREDPTIKEGQIAIGGVWIRNEQPILREGAGQEPFSIAGNVKIANREEIREKFPYLGGSDLEICAGLASQGKTPVERLENVFQNVKGRFGLVMLTPDGVFACRDPLGFKPLAIGRNKKEGGCAVATESAVLPEIGMELVREVKRGEIIEINSTGFNTLKQILPEKKPEAVALCGFEFGYYAGPASIFEEIAVGEARFNMGAILAQKYGVEADIISPFPLSGEKACEGYGFISKIPLVSTWQYNSQFGRSFLDILKQGRKERGKGKLIPIEWVIRRFKRIIMVDDSIVEANQLMMRLFRIAALIRRFHPELEEKIPLHLRIACPPKIKACPLEVPLRYTEDLFATNNTREEMRRKLGVASLEFNTVEDYLKSLEKAQSEEKKKENPLKPEKEICMCCFTGEDLISKYFK